MSDNKAYEFNTDSLHCLDAPSPVLPQDIFEIGNVADAIMKVFETERDCALEIAIRLKAQELRRDLSSLRELI